MMNRQEPLFQNGTGRQKGIPKDVDETHPYQNVPSEIISLHCIVCSSNGCGAAMDQWITLHLNGSDAQRPEAITTKAALPGQKASAFTNSPVSAL